MNTRLIALVTFTIFCVRPGNATLLLLDEHGEPRCRISGGLVGEYLSAEQFSPFVVTQTKNSIDLKDCEREDALYAGMVLAPQKIQVAGPPPEGPLAIVLTIPLGAAIPLSYFRHVHPLFLPMATFLVTAANVSYSCYLGELHSEYREDDRWTSMAILGSLFGFYQSSIRYIDEKTLGPRFRRNLLRDQIIQLAGSLLPYWVCKRIAGPSEDGPQNTGQDQDADSEGEEISETFLLYDEDGVQGPDRIRNH